MDLAEVYKRIKEQARIRQKRYYDKHRDEILNRKLEQRNLFRELKKQQGPELPVPKEPSIAPIEIPVFSNLTRDEFKKIKKSTKSTTNLKEILEKFKNFSMTGSKDSYRTYKGNVEQLYSITDTSKDKAINLNNVELIFQKLDEFKKPNGEPYSIDKMFLMIQVIVILSDPQNNFSLGVTKEAFDIYKKKFAEFKILKSRKQQSNQAKSVPLFSDILKKAKSVFGEDSEFYLYLRIYQLAPLRDDFQLLIVDNEKKANKKTENYIVAKDKTGMIIINHYKTQARYDQLKYKLTPEVLQLVKDFIQRQAFHYNKDDYLFGNGKMSNWVGACLKKINIDIQGQKINTLRHSIVS